MSREWVVTVGASERTIEVTASTRGDSHVELTAGGETFAADVAHVQGNTYSVLLGHRSIVVHLPGSKGGAALAALRGVVLAGSAELELLIEDARRKRLAAMVGASSDTAGEVVRAPIAGRVVKVLVETGAEVAPGDSLVVLEAMKMENEIKATRAGTVADVHVSANQAVDAKQILVTIA